MSDIAVAANGDIFVTDQLYDSGAGAIVRIDPLTGALSVVSRNFGFLGLGIGPDGDLLATGLLHQPGPAVYTLVEVDPSSGARTVLSTDGLFNGVRDVVDDGSGRLLVASPSALGSAHGAIIAVDPVTGAQSVFSSAPVNSGPYGIVIVPIPEPGTLGLLAVGVFGLASRRRVGASRARRAGGPVPPVTPSCGRSAYPSA
jgi:hypothetical protein